MQVRNLACGTLSTCGTTASVEEKINFTKYLACRFGLARAPAPAYAARWRLRHNTALARRDFTLLPCILRRTQYDFAVDRQCT
jgi:hypothetical protein